MGIPATALTLDQLTRKIAEKLGVASYRTDGTVYLPVDSPFNLEKCIERVNQGIQLFIDGAPREGWRWMRRLATVTFAPAVTGTASAGTSTSLTDSDLADDYDDDYWNGYTLKITDGTGEDETATVTDYDGTLGKFTFSGGLSGSSTPDTTSEYRICHSTDVIDADPARYMLPTDFGGEVLGKIAYAAETNHSTPIQWTDESVIRVCRSTVVHSGYPLRAAIRPYQPTSSVIASGRQWEIIFDPEPTVADVVEFPYLLYFDGVRLYGGTADSASATTIVDATLATWFPKDDDLNGWYAEIVNGTGQGSYAAITDYTGSTGSITVADWLAPDGDAGGTDPSTSSEFVLMPVRPYYHPCGFAYDGVVEAACLAACEIYGTEMVSEHHTELFFKRKLPEAVFKNARMAPRRLGKMTDGPRQTVERTREDVTTDHDV
jgi:hypothetical protein